DTFDTSGTTDDDAANDTDTETTTVNTSADVSVTKSGDSFGIAGDPGGVLYQLSIHNAGPSDAQAVQLQDVLPAGTTCLSLTETDSLSPTQYTCIPPACGTNGTVTCTRS